MEECTAPNNLAMMNSLHSSVSDVEAYMDIAENSGSKSYTLLQGANLNGSFVGGGFMSAANGMIHLNNESSGNEQKMLVRKPCPLEMSIKAANLDTEFENMNYFSATDLEFQPSITTYGTLMSSEPDQPLVLAPQKQNIGLHSAPLQVLLVQFQPQDETSSPVVTYEAEESVAVPSSALPAVEQIIPVVETHADSASELILNVVENSSNSSSVEVEAVEKRKPGVESLVMKFRKVPSKNNAPKKWKASLWTDSDDEPLAEIAKRRQTEKCCSRCCCMKVSSKKQQIARDQFTDLELVSQGDLYLANCIKPVDKLPLSPWSNSDDDISEEIANESNGNKTLSDEIQNAIKESLKDQQTSAKISTNCDWQYSIVTHNRSRIVCLRFLLSVLQIPESRLSELKKRILNGEVLERLPVTELQSKYTKVWELAKRHLDTFPRTPLPYCKVTPPHLTTYPVQSGALLQDFQDFYLREEGAPVGVQLMAYEKFLKTQKMQCSEKCAICENGRKKKGDVFSLMLMHLQTIPFKIPEGCCSPKPHKFFSPDRVTIPMLYQEYRKYFLRETNSELGLRYAIYESLLLRNPFFTIADIDSTTGECPRCRLISNQVSPPSKTKNNKKDRKKKKKKTSSR